MSARRQPGDKVWLKPGAGFGVPDTGAWGIIRADDTSDPCTLHMVDRCVDPDCREWPNVDLLDHVGGRTNDSAYHVPECHMADDEEAP